MEQYLDSTGLQLYDSKIKTYISDTVSVLNDDISELNTKVSSLNGAIRYIGKIEQFTADVTQQLLTQTAAAFGYETLEIGLTLVDKNANDWVVCEPDSETPWVNIGYYELNIATQSELGLVKGGEQISVDNNGELHLVKLNNFTTGGYLDLTGSLSVGSGYQFTADANGNIHGSGISIGSGNQFSVNANGNIHGSGISIGSGNQFSVDANGNIRGSGISIGSGNQFSIDANGNIHGLGIFIGTGNQFVVDANGYVSGSKISINIGRGYLTGSGFSINASSEFGHIRLISGGISIYDASDSNCLLELSCSYNEPSIKLGSVNIVTSGSRINAQYLTGKISTGVSFSTLSNDQIYELKTKLGIL